jgi:hypothetical protein
LTFKAFASLRRAFPEKLNEGEAKGWTLKSTFTPSQINSVYIVWDTKG